MYEPCAGSTRLGFAREILNRTIRALKEGTPFAITVYANRGCNSGPLVAANDLSREAAMRFIMHDFDCGGGTNLPAGLASAKQLHPGHIILLSDGDLNMGLIEILTKVGKILGPKDRGPALTIVGISPRPNTGDEQTLESLADQQGGNYQAEHFDGAELLTEDKTEAGAH
jgi:hypothetical protein